ncbi:uncharacterized protein LOC128673725 isoform X2 [Plodia interpunctella]|uniref:uncharacterized protein LOC128673725 isoform X2 n=1 Tax=Plodia interpunctella TaxID=58824 RepID=UPI0023688285|nr:uncharacterized protein LOC128673725 isoform X2 [Plodia interpunctella]
MKADTDAWWAAALLVAAARWPAAAAAAPNQAQEYDWFDCDFNDIDNLDCVSLITQKTNEIEDEINAHPLDDNLTDSVLNFKLEDNDFFLMFVLALNSKEPHIHTRRKRFPYKYYPQLNRKLPIYNTSEIFPPRDMTFVPRSRMMNFLYKSVAPSIVQFTAPMPTTAAMTHVFSEVLNVSLLNMKMNPVFFCCLASLLSGPVAFIFILLTVPLLTIFCWMAAWRRRSLARRTFDYKCDCFFKYLFAFLLFAAMGLYLYGVWGFIVSGEQLETGVQDLFVAVCNFTRSFAAYLRRAKDGIYVTGIPVYQKTQLSAFTSDYFKLHWWWKYYTGWSMPFFDFIIYGNRRAAMKSLGNITGVLEDVQLDLALMKEHTSMLWSLANELNTELRNVKRTLLQSLTSCDAPACLDLQRMHHFLDIDTEIRHVQTVLDNVTELRDQGLHDDVTAGLRFDFWDFKLDVPKTHYYRSGHQVLNALYKMNQMFLKRMYWWAESFYPILEVPDKIRAIFITRYLPYIQFTVALISFFLIVPVVMILGLPHCCYGSRRRVYRGFTWASLRSSSFGSRLIYWSIAASLLPFLVCGLGAAVFYLASTLLQRVICEPLEKPTQSIMFDFIWDRFVDIEKLIFGSKANYSYGLKFSRVIEQLRTPKTPLEIYNVFQIYRQAGEEKHRFIHIRKRITWTTVWIGRLRKSLEEMSIRQEPPTSMMALSDLAMRSLLRLVDIRFSDLAVDRIPSTMKSHMQQFTKKSREMALLSEALERAADRRGYGAVPAELRAAAAALRDLRLNIVLPMLQEARVLNWIPIMNIADYYVDITSDFLLVYRKYFEKFLPQDNLFMIHEAKIRLTLCENFYLPMQGLWVCMGLCWLMLLVMIWSGRTLARICLRTDPYPGAAVQRAYKEIKRFAEKNRKLRRRGKRTSNLCRLCTTACDDNELPLSKRRRC